jgi:hypothetical protein
MTKLMVVGLFNIDWIERIILINALEVKNKQA